jgi:general secretion pathway protein C
MVTTISHIRISRLVTFAVSAMAAGCLVAWAIKWQSVHFETSVAAADMGEADTVNTMAVGKALGAVADTPLTAEVQALASSRFVLVGVAARVNQQGTALIAVDGKPPRPFEIGAPVGEDWRLSAVSGRHATLAKQSGSDGKAVAGDIALQLALPPKIGD